LFQKIPKTRGHFAKSRLSSSLRQGAPAWRLPGHRPRHLLLALADEDPLEPHLDATSPPPSLSLAALPFFPVVLFLFSVKTHSSRSPTHSTAIPCLPQPLRRAEKVCLAVLLLLAKGIEPGHPELPPPSPLPRRKPSCSAAKFTAAGPSPAKTTSPAGSR
jgi:hypothetical protein